MKQKTFATINKTHNWIKVTFMQQFTDCFQIITNLAYLTGEINSKKRQNFNEEVSKNKRINMNLLCKNKLIK